MIHRQEDPWTGFLLHPPPNPTTKRRNLTPPPCRNQIPSLPIPRNPSASRIGTSSVRSSARALMASSSRPSIQRSVLGFIAISPFHLIFFGVYYLIKSTACAFGCALIRMFWCFYFSIVHLELRGNFVDCAGRNVGCDLSFWETG